MAGFMKKLFRGADTPAEEKAEARAVRSGKITPKQYVAGEKSEGETEPGMLARAKALKSGKMSPAAYAKHEGTEKMKKGGCATAKKMKSGGCATKKMAAGGGVEAKGKTNGKTVKMAKGGKVDGCAVKGKTRAKKV